MHVSEFVMIRVYLDDLNILGICKELSKAVEYLKEFKMKDSGRRKLCLCYKLNI